MKGRIWSVWLVLRHCVALGIVVGASFSARGQSGLHITPPAALNSNAARDTGNDYGPQIVTDGRGVWLVMWTSDDDLDGTIGKDTDLLCSRSTDNGATWSEPRPVNSNAATDIGRDHSAQLVTDRKGRWIVVWSSDDDLGGRIGDDSDILFARSDDNGESWTAPTALNQQAGSDDSADYFPQLSTDGDGTWIAAWTSTVAYWTDLPWSFWSDDVSFVRSSDNGVSWSAQDRLNGESYEERGSKRVDALMALGQGEWLVVWRTEDTHLTGPLHWGVWVARSGDSGETWSQARLGLGWRDVRQLAIGGGNWLLAGRDRGQDPELQCTSASSVWFSRSGDQGLSWSDPTTVLNPLPCGNFGDSCARLATDGRGAWVLTWSSSNSLGETLGDDLDVLLIFSNDDGVTWTPPAALNGNSATDADHDGCPDIATDGLGHWIAVWSSGDDQDGTIGADTDILVARFAWPDCNANLRPDDEDIAGGFSSDENGDGIPDECEGDDGSRDGGMDEHGDDGEPPDGGPDGKSADNILSGICPLATLSLFATALTGVWITRQRTAGRR